MAKKPAYVPFWQRTATRVHLNSAIKIMKAFKKANIDAFVDGRNTTKGTRAVRIFVSQQQLRIARTLYYGMEGVE